MTETCSCPPETGNDTCDLPNRAFVASCPICLKTGMPVDTLTLKALLNVPLTEIRQIEYRFYKTPDCSVVYYSQDGAQIFLKIDLREQAHWKRQGIRKKFGGL